MYYSYELVNKNNAPIYGMTRTHIVSSNFTTKNFALEDAKNEVERLNMAYPQIKIYGHPFCSSAWELLEVHELQCVYQWVEI